MNAETKSILAGLKFSSVTSQLSKRDTLRLGMNVTIKRNGTSTILFFNDGMPDFLLFKNHSAGKLAKGVRYGTEEHSRGAIVKTVCDGKVPYLTLATDKLITILESIARMRLLVSGRKSWIKNHQTWSKRLARVWFRFMPSEENDLYMRDLAVNSFESALASSFGPDSE